jgi:hypothetical protein
VNPVDKHIFATSNAVYHMSNMDGVSVAPPSGKKCPGSGRQPCDRESATAHPVPGLRNRLCFPGYHPHLNGDDRSRQMPPWMLELPLMA